MNNLERKILKEKLAHDTAAFIAGGGKIYMAEPGEHGDTRSKIKKDMDKRRQRINGANK